MLALFHFLLPATFSIVNFFFQSMDLRFEVSLLRSERRDLVGQVLNKTTLIENLFFQVLTFTHKKIISRRLVLGVWIFRSKNGRGLLIWIRSLDLAERLIG